MEEKKWEREKRERERKEENRDRVSGTERAERERERYREKEQKRDREQDTYSRGPLCIAHCLVIQEAADCLHLLCRLLRKHSRKKNTHTEIGIPTVDAWGQVRQSQKQHQP